MTRFCYARSEEENDPTVLVEVARQAAEAGLDVASIADQYPHGNAWLYALPDEVVPEVA